MKYSVADLSPAVQDYVRAIYALGQPDGRRVTTSELADYLDLAPASVTSMLQKLESEEPALVDYRKRAGANLTDMGLQAAETLAHNHHLLELFLHNMLGYSWAEVDDEARQLEQAISPALVERLAEILE